jgi:FkbM family methyltransferase
MHDTRRDRGAASAIGSPRLSVVIPTYNNEAVLRRCLASWRKAASQHDLEMVVLEDGCVDGTRALLQAESATLWGRRHLAWAHMDDAHELRCTNAGFARSRAGLILAWQDDMFVRAGWLVPELVRAFQRYPELGMLSLSRGLNYRPVPAPIASWNDLVDWSRLESTIGPRPWNWLRIQEVDAVIRPWIVRRECLQSVGVLDEAFVPTEWDEADLAFRIRRAGWKVATCGYERLQGYEHLGSSTLGVLSEEYKARVLGNGLLFHSRWDTEIAAEGRRERRAWLRPQTLSGWANTCRHIAAACLRQGFGAVNAAARPRLKQFRDVAAAVTSSVLFHAPSLERVYGLVAYACRGVPGAHALCRETTDRLARRLTHAGREHRRIEIGGVEMIFDVTDFAARGGYFSRLPYEPGATDVVLTNLPRGGVFVDVGANAGYFSVLAALRAGPAGRVFAFEPQPDTRARLLRHVDVNGVGDRVIVSRSALGRGDRATASLFTSCMPGNSGLSSIAPSAQALASGALRPDVQTQVPLQTFDRWAADAAVRQIDIVKIDVEGAELDVLEGMAETFAARPPRYVICETAVDGAARRRLEAWGYRSSVIDPVPGGVPNLLFWRDPPMAAGGIMTAAAETFRRPSLLEHVAGRWPRRGLAGRLRRSLRSVYAGVLRLHAPFTAVLPGGEVVRVAPALRGLTWNPAEYAAFREAVRPGDVVLDVGANVGAYAVLFGQWVGPSGVVYAFEPDPRAFDGLERQIALNDAVGRVRGVRAAASNRSRSSVPFLLAPSPGVGRLIDGREPGASIDVRTMSIDDFCEQTGVAPSVIKIDVEGAELDVLAGARRTIQSAGDRLALFVEMHPLEWRRRGIHAASVAEQCAAMGLAAESLDGGPPAWSTEGVCLRLRRVAR